MSTIAVVGSSWKTLTPRQESDETLGISSIHHIRSLFSPPSIPPRILPRGPHSRIEGLDEPEKALLQARYRFKIRLWLSAIHF